MPKEDFRREGEKELTGKEEEPSELIYFKVHKSQIPVIERAIETAVVLRVWWTRHRMKILISGVCGFVGKTSTRQLIERNLLGTINVLEYCCSSRAGLILLSDEGQPWPAAVRAGKEGIAHCANRGSEHAPSPCHLLETLLQAAGRLAENEDVAFRFGSV